MCPSCTREAPLVYRGFSAYCAACGARRPVLSGASVTHAGKVQQFGASLFFAAGFAVFVVFALVAAFLGLFVGLVAGSTAGLVTFGIGAAFGALLFLVSWLGSRKVRKSGNASASSKLQRAVYEAAALRGGVVTAEQLGPLLSMPVDVVDRELSTLASQRGDEVSVDVDDRGAVVYRFFRLLEVKPRGAWAPSTPMGSSSVPHAARVRVSVGPEQDGSPSPPVSAPPVSARDARVVDAEFELIDEANERRTAR